MNPDYHVAVIGAGFSGLGMAIQLKRHGIEDFVVLEKAADLGGTWRENHYPGCACDIPAHLYSFSFARNPNWSRKYAAQPEIWDYLRACVERFGIGPHLRYRHEVVAAEFDEEVGWWRLSLADGRTLTARAVVAGLGPLHEPSYPVLPGLDAFEGTTFHSAQWDHDFDFAGKRVAVIGTGASSIQFVPRIQPQVEALHLFQRTPAWILPKPDRRLRPAEHRLFRNPVVGRAYRHLVYATRESQAVGFLNPKYTGLPAWLARRHLRRQVPDPELRARLTPDYTIGCKRILPSNDFYPAVGQPNVELVTGEIAEVRPHSVVGDDGVERPVDAIVFGTGFKIAEQLHKMKITGRAGVTLEEAWQDGMTAYLGITVSGFPNLFFLLGPNTGLGHNSVVFMAEAQIRYTLAGLTLLNRNRADYLDVRPEVQRAFNADIQSKLANTVWNTGCKSWYLDEHGVNRTIWPGYTVTYWRRTRRPNPTHYELTRITPRS
jgi:cation diffusion facilitator CzcD-associated flavoprotein CzcO